MADSTPSSSDAVLVFDARGRRLAGTAGSDQAIGGAPIASYDELMERFRQPDGMRLSLEGEGSRVAVEPGPGGRRFMVTSHLLAEDPAGGVATGGSVVVLQGVDDDDDPLTMTRLLGSVLAHELRTPLTTIFGGAQLVADPSVSAATRTEASRSIAREAQRLHGVVEDLLTLIRLVPSDPAVLEPVLLQRVLPPVIEAHRRLASSLEVESSLPRSLPAVLASEHEIALLVDNLLAHATDYSPAEGPIRIRARRAANAVEIRVSDLGPGRDAREAAHAFELFTRSARSTADASGANLRLVVARRLVERMRGRIWAKATPHGGEIGFAFPAANANGP